VDFRAQIQWIISANRFRALTNIAGLTILAV
jgi:hypothetical protein